MNRKWIFIVLFLSVSIILGPFACAGTDKMKQAFPENDTEGYVPVDVISIDPAIKAATPHYVMLTADAEGRQNLLDSINRTAYDTDGREISKETKEELKNGIVTIWERYPVVFIRSPGSPGYPTYGGSTIHIQFADNRTGIALTDSENRLLERIQILNSYNYRRAGNPADTSSSGYPDGVPATRPVPVPAGLVIIAIGCSGLIAAVRK